jgi:(R,R)-butanediol dehydrogenase / meso-butanediol dehydrogenase / diacetyl reductase
MKAAVYRGPNEVAVAEVPKPGAGAGELIPKVHDCGVCGSDLHAVQYGIGMPPGTVMGHEFCGEIHEIGPGVSGYKPGERVTALPFSSCGTCDLCRQGQGIHCAEIRALGLGDRPGAYAEFVSCDASSLVRLPDGVSSREGALVEPLSVGLHGVNRSRVKPGSVCIVMGAGPIGLATLIWCKAKGAGVVVVSEPAAGRAELAWKLGATAVVDPNAQSPADKVRDLADRGPDVIFECVGVKSTLETATRLVPPLGQVVVLGVCMEPDQITPVRCVFKEINLDFALGYTRAEFEETIEALAAGRLNAGPLVTDVISVERVPEMFQALRKPGARGKVLVEFPH